MGSGCHLLLAGVGAHTLVQGYRKAAVVMRRVIGLETEVGDSLYRRQLLLVMTQREGQADTDINCSEYALWPICPNISHVANAPAFSRS